MTDQRLDDQNTITFQYRLSISAAIRAKTAHSGEWNYLLTDEFVERLVEEGLDDVALPYLSDAWTEAARMTITGPPPEGIFRALRVRRDQVIHVRTIAELAREPSWDCLVYLRGLPEEPLRLEHPPADVVTPNEYAYLGEGATTALVLHLWASEVHRAASVNPADLDEDLIVGLLGEQMPPFARPETPDGRRMASAALHWLPDLVRSRIERHAVVLPVAATRRTSP